MLCIVLIASATLQGMLGLAYTACGLLATSATRMRVFLALAV